MRTSFDTPLLLKVISYSFICLTPIAIYLIIFIAKIQISNRIDSINILSKKLIAAPFIISNHRYQYSKRDIAVQWNNKQFSLDSFNIHSDSIFIFLNEGFENTSLIDDDDIIVNIKKKLTLYDIFNTNE